MAVKELQDEASMSVWSPGPVMVTREAHRDKASLKSSQESNARTTQTYSIAQVRTKGPRLSLNGLPVALGRECGVEASGEAD